MSKKEDTTFLTIRDYPGTYFKLEDDRSEDYELTDDIMIDIVNLKKKWGFYEISVHAKRNTK